MESKVFRWFRNDVKVTPFKKVNATSPSELDSCVSETDAGDDSKRSEDHNDCLLSPDSNSISDVWEEARDGATKSGTPVSALDFSVNDFSDLSINLSNTKNSPSPQLSCNNLTDLNVTCDSKSSIDINGAKSPIAEGLNSGLEITGETSPELKCDSPSKLNGDDPLIVDTVILESATKLPCELEFANGSDSGVETNGKYFKETEIEASCNSSQISRSSSPYQFDSEELLSSCSAANSQTLHFSDTHTSLDYNYGEGTSEAGSESSCVTGSGSLKDAKIKKKTVEKSVVRGRPPFTSNASPRDTCRKNIHFSTMNAKTSAKLREPSEVRTKPTRSLSSSRSKIVPAIDDGRWPYAPSKSHTAVSRQKSNTSHPTDKKSPSCSAAESKANAQVIEKYATLPRRRRQKSNENLVHSHDSSSRHRDPSLNKTEILRRKHRDTNLMTSSLTTNFKTLPPYPGVRSKSKTKIYHETCTQTTFTADDIEQLVAGNPVTINERRVETMDASLQVDFRNEQIETLQSSVKQLKEELLKTEAESTAKKQELNKTKRELESSKLMADIIQQQFKAYEDRICKLLLKKISDVSGDYLSELERQTLCMNDIVKKQQAEIKTLHHTCSKLQKELDKTTVAQKSMIQSQQELELESLEMQDFLQTEKLALADSIKDLENEVLKQKQLVREKDKELSWQKEEYLKLAQVAEQRRQENEALQAKVNTTEQRSKAFLLEQGASVSGASVALSGLGDRLESLIEQLVVAYNISETDLEEVIFHNEAFSQSCSNSDGGSKIQSPLDGKLDIINSYKNSVLSVIRNSSTTQSSDQISLSDASLNSGNNDPVPPSKITLKLGGEKKTKPYEDNSFETENLVPYDISDSLLKKEHSSNDLQLMCDSFQLDGMLGHQQLDKVCFEECEDDRFFNEFYPNHSLVDQVIEIDNLIAKLLKIFSMLQDKQNSSEPMTSALQVPEERINLAVKVSNVLDQMKQLKAQLHPSAKAKSNGEVDSREISCTTSVVSDEPVAPKEVMNHSSDVPENSHDNCTNGLASMAERFSSSLNASS